ncbi:response regulator [Paenibacillus sp. MWE-103]|uniref:histidine kinase n=1 Tax=Paenibacillus artemisiicola TaxID=1172618 RepID=A0ABS3W5I7_9BACL|nr:ATP-binding protein [Paenibacillus artemisiicola]MBO7743553.1 response regulator [Paenibacillus artemisiicola]
MRNRTRLLPLILLFLIGLACCGERAVGAEPASSPRADRGILDLTGWDSRQDGIVALNGDWAFYWSALWTPEDFRDGKAPQPTGYFTTPGYWNRHAAGANYPADGYATLRLKVRTDPQDGVMALKVNNIFSAYRIWVNGELVASAGTVGKDKGSTVARQIVQTAPFRASPGEQELEIVVQLANYSYTKSGFQNAIQLGSDARIEALYRRNMEGTFIAFGACTIMALYHLVLYALRRREHSALYLGLFSLFVAVRIPFVNDRYIYNWFPDMNWELFCKVPYAVFFFCSIMIAMFVRSLYPRYFARPIVVAMQASGAAATLFCLLTPQRWYDKLLIPYELLTCGFIGYTLYVLIRAMRDRQAGTLTFMIGFAGLSGTIVHDFLYMSEITHLGSLAPYGLLIFIAMQSLILAGRFVRAFTEVERMSSRLLDMDKTKDEFLAQTSHELRTPLHGMIGLSESLIDGVAGELPEQAVHNLQLVVSSGRRLAALVGDVLDYAQLKHKDLTLIRSDIDLRSAVGVALQLNEPLLGGRRVRLANDVPGRLNVSADENRLQQILHNLIGNAVKFTDSGSIAVSASEAGGDVEVRVTDTGSGIPEAVRARIFDAYEQAGGVRREGTGLGLAVTKKLVELHGGTIRIETPPDGGACIVFTLPRPARQTAPMPQAAAGVPRREARTGSRTAAETEDMAAMREPGAEEEDGDGSRLSGARILIVDDEAVNLQVLRNHLTMDGYDVIEAADPEEALMRLESGFKPDLAILDVMLPRMSGFELCARIRERYSAGELPVIFLTAKPLDVDVIEGFDAGANDYLTKPVVKRELLARIRLHLRLAHWNRALERRVKERTEQLEEALASLQQARNRLIQAEKLASLGELIAGIAHEMNSPIGIGVTASSHLAERTKALLARYGEGGLRKSELEAYLAESSETADILLGNLRRAERLIATFKQVAVDQTFEERRSFGVRAYMEEILLSISPKLKQSRHRVVLHIEPSLATVGFPGAFYHIMTNLLLNSLLHAYDDGQAGTIVIRAEADAKALTVTYADDGKGIEPELIPRIFDPFVTTKRGRGGTGLGLSVVYNLVVQTWGGTIVCDSVAGHGTAFQLVLPLPRATLEGTG